MVNIPIVLASDKNGIFQMYTTILSAIENKNNDTFYEFYCLIPSKFSKFVNKKFYKLTQKYKNVSIKFIKMGTSFSNIKMQIAHITSPTFYRLKIAELLPNRDKAIYLDIDTIVLADLKELYYTDLGDNYIGGVHHASFALNKNEDSKKYYDSIGFKDMKYYINAGVILWNLKQIRKNNLTKSLIELSQNTYRVMDQDIINLACYGKIKHIDLKYNLMTSFNERFLSNTETTKEFYEFYGEKEVKSALDKPIIIHYASSKKPWIDKTSWLSEYWLKYSKKCPFEKVNKKNFKQKFLNQIKENKFKKTMFWGASLFLEELVATKQVKQHKILGIIDKNTKRQGEKIGNFKIYPPEILDKIKPDIIIFSILNNYSTIYPEIKKIVNKNYPKVKILPCAFGK